MMEVKFSSNGFIPSLKIELKKLGVNLPPAEGVSTTKCERNDEEEVLSRVSELITGVSGQTPREKTSVILFLGIFLF